MKNLLNEAIKNKKWIFPRFGNPFKIICLVQNVNNAFDIRVQVENIKGKVFYMKQEEVIKLLLQK